VTESLEALAAGAADDYRLAVAAVLRTFEIRQRYLEDIPVADTVLALEALAEKRDMSARLTSQLLPDREQRSLVD
jgi:hypothetical protein